MVARGSLVGAFMAAVSLVGITFAQAPLAENVARVKVKADIFYLPPAPQLKRMTLGYDAAACDVLWAKLLIEYGRHWAEKRTLEHDDVVRFLDALIVLDKDFPPIYRYVDTVLVYRPLKGEREDALAARAYLEEGTRLHPRDPKVWLHYGEFLAYLGLAWMDVSERDEWRRTGALAIVRAVELGAKEDRTLAAVTLLNATGEHEAARRALERAYAVADDEETRSDIRRQLDKLTETEASNERDRQRLFIERRRTKAMPFMSPPIHLLLGPTNRPLECIGPGSSARAECASDWPTALAVPP